VAGVSFLDALSRRRRGLRAATALPHPGWLDALPNHLTLLSRGGALWLAGGAGAWLLGAPHGGRALLRVLCGVAGATLLVEYPLKRLVGHPRPAASRVRSAVLGRRHGSSFPSGDAASSFAGAWALGTVWPRWAPVFLALPTAQGYARVRVRAHHPGDVAAGAAVGVAAAELTRRALRTFLPDRPDHA
jgi:membrane-associated phospholipid phosphatase